MYVGTFVIRISSTLRKHANTDCKHLASDTLITTTMFTLGLITLHHRSLDLHLFPNVIIG